MSFQTPITIAEAIPGDLSLAFSDFVAFSDRRKTLLATKLKEILK